MPIQLQPYDTQFFNEHASWVKYRRSDQKMTVYHTNGQKTKIPKQTLPPATEIFDSKDWYVVKDCYINARFFEAFLCNTNFFCRIFHKFGDISLKQKHSGDAEATFRSLAQQAYARFSVECFYFSGDFVHFVIPWRSVDSLLISSLELILYPSQRLPLNSLLYLSPETRRYFNEITQKECFKRYFEIRIEDYQRRYINIRNIDSIVISGYDGQFKHGRTILSFRVAVIYDVQVMLDRVLNVMQRLGIEPSGDYFYGTMGFRQWLAKISQLDYIRVAPQNISFSANIVRFSSYYNTETWLFDEPVSATRLLEIEEKISREQFWLAVSLKDNSKLFINTKNICSLEGTNKIMVAIRFEVKHYTLPSNLFEDVDSAVTALDSMYKSCTASLKRIW